MSHERFSSWLRQHLKTSGLSIAEVARRYGNRSYQIVWKYKEGIHAPSEEHIDEFAKAVDVHPNVLREILGYSTVDDGEDDLRRAATEVMKMLRPLSPRARAAVVAVTAETARQVGRL